MQQTLWTREYILTTLTNMAVSINFYLLLVSISDFSIRKIGTSDGAAGFAVGVFIIGALIARVIVGRVLLRVGYKRMLLLGVLLGTVFSVLYFFVDSITELYILRFVHGLTFGMAMTSTATIISDIIPQKRRGEGVGYYALAQTLTSAIGPFLGLYFVQQGSYDSIFLISSISAGVGIILTSFIKLPRYLLYEGGKTETDKPFHIRNIIEVPVLPIATLCVIVFLCFSSVASFLAIYTRALDIGEYSNYFFIIYPAVVIATRPFVGKLFDRKNENVLVYPAFVCYGIGMLVLSMTNGAGMLFLSAVLIGFGMGAIMPSLQAIVVKITPRQHYGRANATYFMGMDLGNGAGPMLVGGLIPLVGFSNVYLIAAILLACCIPFYYAVHGKKSGLP